MLGGDRVSSGGWTSLLRFGVGGCEVDGFDSDVGQGEVEVVEVGVGSVILLKLDHIIC